MRRLAIGALAAAGLVAALAPAAAFAHRWEVFPGDSIRHVVKQANPGDTILIHPGKYRTHLKINKKINLVGIGAKRPIIDAGCQATDTVRVTSPGVAVTGLQLQGAEFSASESHASAELLFENVASGKAYDLRTIDTCPTHAEYGIGAVNTGPVKVTDNYGKGFSDSAIYIGGITNTFGSTLIVQGNTAEHNSRGIIVANSNLPSASISVTRNHLNDNTMGVAPTSDGLFLQNSDGVLIKDNTANDNGDYGFHADVDSNGNIFKGNSADANGVAPFVEDTPGSNCGGDFGLPSHC